MKTLYAACLSRLGLTQTGAADLHGVNLSTVKAWVSGRRTPPSGIWDELRAVEDEIREMASSGHRQTGNDAMNHMADAVRTLDAL